MMSLGIPKANKKERTLIFLDSPSSRCSKITSKCFKVHPRIKMSHPCLLQSTTDRPSRLLSDLINPRKSNQGPIPLGRSTRSSSVLNRVATLKNKMYRFNKICSSFKINLSRKNARSSRRRWTTPEPMKVKI